MLQRTKINTVAYLLDGSVAVVKQFIKCTIGGFLVCGNTIRFLQFRFVCLTLVFRGWFKLSAKDHVIPQLQPPQQGAICALNTYLQ